MVAPSSRCTLAAVCALALLPLRAAGQQVLVGIYYARSLDGGATFGAPALLSTGIGQANNPRLAAGDDALHLVWSETAPPDDPFRVTRRGSGDFGATWDPPRRVSTSARYGGWPALAAAGATATAVWQDDRDKLLEVDSAAPAIDRQHNFEIYAATALPEPSMPLLLAAGVPMLAGCRRLRRDRSAYSSARRPSITRSNGTANC
jgi:hypothetical protein